ncbi:MAG: PRC-barrel domain-containing protein [Candidatus Odinarchaeota archaeon]
MIQCCNLKYSEIKKKEVVDSNGERVGEVIDGIFSYHDQELELKYLILGGGMIEEFLESIRARPDIDPVCRIADIDSISDKVYLKIDKDSLCKTLDKCTISNTDIKYSQLGKMKVVDSDDIKIGNVIDIWFDTAGHLWLVLGGGFFEELLEKLHAAPDIDLLVPVDFLDSINKKTIKLNRTRFQLESTCESEYEKLKREMSDRETHKDARFVQIKMGAGGAGLSRGFA